MTDKIKIGRDTADKIEDNAERAEQDGQPVIAQTARDFLDRCEVVDD